MSLKVMIYGTVGLPYIKKAREAYGEKAVFIDVESDLSKLREMLNYSDGSKQIPVIVEGDKVTIGF